jgi:hypothetical protein
MFTRGSIGTVVLLVVVASMVGCGRSAKYIRPYQCDAQAADVAAIWDCNRNVIVRTIHRKKFSLREFWGAAEFFEGLTGIEADTRDSRQGPLPGPALAENLEAWDRWYRDNQDRLVRDAATGEVRLVTSGPGR